MGEHEKEWKPQGLSTPFHSHANLFIVKFWDTFVSIRRVLTA